MTNNLQFILKLADQLSPALRHAAQISNSATSQIENQFSNVNNSGKRMSASVNELRSRLDAINKIRFSTTIEREFNSSTRAAQKLESQIQKLESKGKPGGLMGLLGGFAVGAGAIGLGKMALGEAANREQQNVSFEVLTGSKKTGTEMVNNLVSMGAKTPYESGDLIKNAQTLKAFGIENQKVIPILNTLGDIAGGNAEKLSSLSLAFAQASSAGKLSGQDLLQMVNAGFNPLQQMVTDKVFPSMIEARKAMEKGAIGTNMMEAAFKSATGPGGAFYKMMEKQSMTLSGRYSTCVDNLKLKLLSLGKTIEPIASKFLDFGSDLLAGEPYALILGSAIGILTLSLTWASIQTTLYSAATRSATFFTGLWTGAQAILNATLWANPITWIIAAIIALIAIIGYVIYTTDGWGKQWDSIVKFFKFSWESFKDFFYLKWLEVQDGFMVGIEVMEKGWYKLKSLWDSEGAKAGLAKINDTQNQRAAEIARAKGVLDQDLKAAQASLKWELHSNGKGLDDMTADIKKKLGISTAKAVDPTTANAPAGASKVDYGKLNMPDAKGKSDSINQGGQRSIVINIGKQIEKLEVHVLDAKEGANEIEEMVREAMRRAYLSLNAGVS